MGMEYSKTSTGQKQSPERSVKMEEKSQEAKNVYFICHNCGPAGKILSEQWTKHTDGPHTIDVIQHEKGVAMLVSKISIKPKPDGKQLFFSFCADCGELTRPPVEIDERLQFLQSFRRTVLEWICDE